MRLDEIYGPMERTAEEKKPDFNNIKLQEVLDKLREQNDNYNNDD